MAAQRSLFLALNRLSLSKLTLSSTNHATSAGQLFSDLCWSRQMEQILRDCFRFSPPQSMSSQTEGYIERRVLRLHSPNKSASSILQNWVDEGHNFMISDLRHISKLINFQRYRHALEIYENVSFWMSTADCATRLDLIVKVHGMSKAEESFTDLPNSTLKKAACFPFLHCYVNQRNTEEAEAFMLRLNELSPAQNKIPLTFLSYDLWMRSYGMVQNAIITLQAAEEKLSTCNRFGHLFLITLYASLNNKEGVLRLWEANKAVDSNITCANYMTILGCMVKLGNLGEAEKIFMEWDSTYAGNGLMDKVESLHLHTLETGGSSNYKTWEILIEGRLKWQNMEKATDAMTNGFPMLKHCRWRPSDNTVINMAAYFEKQGVEDAYKYLKFLHHAGLTCLAVYKSLLRMYHCAQRPALDILEMMKRDKIEFG
ncbi:hypothetical protein RJ641_031612 [Dillenia turbinata]|uniref:Pentatricopeptide repeat-containing protein n=1 Tax=Dillenia turbinata TaxID=194707 RepID=A0AAN8VUN3_9MAGN